MANECNIKEQPPELDIQAGGRKEIEFGCAKE